MKASLLSLAVRNFLGLFCILTVNIDVLISKTHSTPFFTTQCGQYCAVKSSLQLMVLVVYLKTAISLAFLLGEWAQN